MATTSGAENEMPVMATAISAKVTPGPSTEGAEVASGLSSVTGALCQARSRERNGSRRGDPAAADATTPG